MWNHGWMNREDGQANIVPLHNDGTYWFHWRGGTPTRYRLQWYSGRTSYPKILSEGVLEAVIASARLLLSATEEEISEVRTIAAKNQESSGLIKAA